MEHVREDVQDTWRRLAVPALTVHLTVVDAKDEETGFHKALVMVPVCPELLQGWSDPNELIKVIAQEALEHYRLATRWQSIIARGPCRL